MKTQNSKIYFQNPSRLLTTAQRRGGFIALLLFFVLSACQDPEVPAIFKQPSVETISAFATSDNTAEINIVIADLSQPAKEVGVVWAERTNPTLNDNTDNVTQVENEQAISFEARNLQSGKTYYARAYHKYDNEVIYGNEITWTQTLTNEWRRLPSPDLATGEYIYDGDVIFGGTGGDILNVKRINAFTNQAFNEAYYVGFFQWNPSFFGNRPEVPRPFEPTFNPINATFRNAADVLLTLYGAGYRLAPRNSRIYVRNMSILESNGNWEPYPGAEAPTASFGIGQYAYALENLPNGKLWRFDYSVLKWQTVASFPVNVPARYLSVDAGERAFVLVEPTDENSATKELYEFIPTQNQWVRRADFVGSNRRNGAGFALNGRVYYGLGQAPQGGAGLRDIWEYNPATNTWRKTADYPGGGTVSVLAVPTTSGVFMGFGKQARQTSVGGVAYRNVSDFWRFRPRP
ncbi:MAG: hypothetical protein MUE30_01725 [Spirosomaceae bacterium]|jgi:hypothetical protein|nr:hypothetical protein [Spirosomataceae bacterium]